jgi:hypothetical protein
VTLVAATIHDGHITMVADTKVTFTDYRGHPLEAWNRDTYFRALPKIVLLRGDLMVGVAGEDAARVIERLLTQRDASVDGVLEHLALEVDAEFVVAALSPPRLWEVKAGVVDDRSTLPRRGWAGDPKAYEVFRESIEAPGMDDVVVCAQLEMGLRTLTSFDPVKSVGGLLLEASSRSGEFRFRPYFMRVMPPYMEVESIVQTGNTLTLRLVVPDGADATTFQIIVVPGAEQNPGALGFLIPETGKGLVFPQDRPWASDVVVAQSVEELVSAASAHGTLLSTPEVPSGHW